MFNVFYGQTVLFYVSNVAILVLTNGYTPLKSLGFILRLAYRWSSDVDRNASFSLAMRTTVVSGIAR